MNSLERMSWRIAYRSLKILRIIAGVLVRVLQSSLQILILSIIGLKLTLKLPSEILAFKLLRRAGLTRAEKLLVISGMNYQEKNTLYDQAKRSLKKFIGEGVCGVVDLPLVRIQILLSLNQPMLLLSKGVLDHGEVIQALGGGGVELVILISLVLVSVGRSL